MFPIGPFAGSSKVSFPRTGPGSAGKISQHPREVPCTHQFGFNIKSNQSDSRWKQSFVAAGAVLEFKNKDRTRKTRQSVDLHVCIHAHVHGGKNNKDFIEIIYWIS